MRTRRAVAIAALLPVLAVLAGPAYAAPITPGGSTEVTVGSNDTIFSQNKQNEPGAGGQPGQPVDPGRWRQRQHRHGGVQRGRRPHLPVHPGRRRLRRAVLHRRRAYLDPADLHRLLRRVRRAASASRTSRPASRVPRTRLRTGPERADRHAAELLRERDGQSNGDPALAFGPRARRRRDVLLDQRRIGCTTRTSLPPFPGQHPGSPASSAIAVSRTDDIAGAIAGDNDAWMDPVDRDPPELGVVQRQGADLGRQRRVQPDFGNVYVCNVGFRGTAGSEPVLFARSTDGGDSWRQRQLSAATNNAQTGGRQGCGSAPTAPGVVYVVWSGHRHPDPPGRASSRRGPSTAAGTSSGRGRS